MTAREALRIAAARPEVRAALERDPPAYARAYLAGGGRWQVSWFLPPTRARAAAGGDRPGADPRPRPARARGVDRRAGASGRWRAATRASSGARSTRPGSGSGCACCSCCRSRGRRCGCCTSTSRCCWRSRSPTRSSARRTSTCRCRAPTRCSATCSCGWWSSPARPAAPPPRAARRPGVPAARGRVPRRFRVALNVVDGNVIDVGYASVIGADRLAGGRRRSTARSRPTTSTATPTGRWPTRPTCRSSSLLPWTSGSWDDLPAAHAAAIAFDLGCAGLLWLLGRRLRGRARAAARLPVDDLPVHADGRQLGRQRRARRAARAGRAARRVAAGRARRAGGARRADEVRAAGAGAAVRGLPAAAAGSRFARGVRRRARRSPSRRSTSSVLWDRTLGFQQDRDSPFSIWGLLRDPGRLQLAAQAAAVALRRRGGVPAAPARRRRRSPRWPPRC